MSSIGRTVSLCLVFIALVLAMFVYSTLRTPQLSDDELAERHVVLLPNPVELAPFALTDHLGASFTVERLIGKWTFLFFGFTNCPDICPTGMSELGQAERALQQAGGELAEQFQVALVTVDPERDDAQSLGTYATAFSPRFFGVLADREETANFAKQVYVSFAKVPTDDGGYTIDHTGHIAIINPRGHFHGYVKLPHDDETIRLTYQSLAARF